MQVFKVDLYKELGIDRKGADQGYLTCYIREKCSGVSERPAMIVFPGGGYENRSDRESEPIALAYVGQGYHAFVLDYSVFPVTYPAHFNEACMAVYYLRKNAQALGVIPTQIAAVGFSAGGHLLGMLATDADSCALASPLGISPQEFRLNAAVFSYPVVTAQRGVCHEGSVRAFGAVTEEERTHFSVENHVSATSAPAFIWHTVTDDAVPVENAFLLASAYQKAGAPYELHVFDRGPHGLALCNEETFVSWNEFINPHAAHWLPLSVEWLARLGFGVK